MKVRSSNPTPAAPPPLEGIQRRRPLPQGAGYGLKRLVLGPALPTSHLEHERLGKPTALAVFASDALSSVAYATEEILKVAVPAVGVAGLRDAHADHLGDPRHPGILLFSLPPDDQGVPERRRRLHRHQGQLRPAARAGRGRGAPHRLRADRPVSVSAGVAAITSAAPSLYPYRVWFSVFFIWFIAWGNLRGVRDSGRMFAVPTYFFIVMMFTAARVGSLPGVHRQRSTRLPAPPEVARDRRRGHPVPDPARLRVRAAPRSPASRRSRTACRRSSHPSGRTPGRPSCGWAACSARCSWVCRS